jgi:hypothetical protein
MVIRKDAERDPLVLIGYTDEDEEGAFDDLARIDESKERQRRKFVALGKDLNTRATISHVTLAALGKLLA